MLTEMIYDNSYSKTDIIVGNIMGDVLHPSARLAIEPNMCQHKIFSYVQYRYRWKNVKGQKLSDGNKSQLGLIYP